MMHAFVQVALNRASGSTDRSLLCVACIYVKGVTSKMVCSFFQSHLCVGLEPEPSRVERVVPFSVRELGRSAVMLPDAFERVSMGRLPLRHRYDKNLRALFKPFIRLALHRISAHHCRPIGVLAPPLVGEARQDTAQDVKHITLLPTNYENNLLTLVPGH
jgi:hypothetical protein